MIQSVYFTTSRGRIVGGGTDIAVGSGVPDFRGWNADPPPHHNASLARLSCRVVNTREIISIESIEFIWQFVPGNGRGDGM